MNTIGEHRVRTTFNPSANGKVDQIKNQSAELINLISSIEDGTARVDSREVGRLKSLAMTAVEEAAMWAVKAETSARIPQDSNMLSSDQTCSPTMTVSNPSYAAGKPANPDYYRTDSGQNLTIHLVTQRVMDEKDPSGWGYVDVSGQRTKSEERAVRGTEQELKDFAEKHNLRDYQIGEM